MKNELPYHLRLPNEDIKKFFLRLKLFIFIVFSNIVVFILFLGPTLLNQNFPKIGNILNISIILSILTLIIWFFVIQFFYKIIPRSKFLKINSTSLLKKRGYTLFEIFVGLIPIVGGIILIFRYQEYPQIILMSSLMVIIIAITIFFFFIN